MSIYEEVHDFVIKEGALINKEETLFGVKEIYRLGIFSIVIDTNYKTNDARIVTVLIGDKIVYISPYIVKAISLFKDASKFLNLSSEDKLREIFDLMKSLVRFKNSVDEDLKESQSDIWIGTPLPNYSDDVQDTCELCGVTVYRRPFVKRVLCFECYEKNFPEEVDEFIEYALSLLKGGDGN